MFEGFRDFARAEPAVPSRDGSPNDIHWEDDLVYGDDDLGDINPFDRRHTVSVGYAPGAPLQRETTGGGRLGGRMDDGDEATITFRLGTITPEPSAPPPPPPAPKPDLVVTSFSFSGITIKNVGPGPAGAFRVKIGDATTTLYQSFTGLAPGESATHPLDLGSDYTYTATVDDLLQVAESNENNNTATSTVP